MNYDQYPIHTYTMYTMEEVKKARKQNGKPAQAVALVLTILFAVITAVTVGAVADRAMDGLSLVFPIVILAFALVMYLTVRGVLFSKKQYAQMQKVLGGGQQVWFRNTDFVVQNATQEVTGQTQAKYSVVVKAVETGDAFYIYPTKASFYLVSKRGFQTGTPQELSALLRANIEPGKYKMK